MAIDTSIPKTKPKIIDKLNPGESRIINGIRITADDGNTGPVFIGRQKGKPIIWANKLAHIRLG